MTCIVGLAYENGIIVGGDSAGTCGDHITVRNDPKVFRVTQKDGPGAIIGFTGSYRMGQLLMTLKLPKDRSGAKDKDGHFMFLITKVIPIIRQLFKDGGYAKIANEREVGGQFIIGYRNWIYSVESDFQVESPSAPFLSVGAGASYATGALRYIHQYLDPKNMDPTEIVSRALEVAEYHTPSVRGPMKILSLPEKSK